MAIVRSDQNGICVLRIVGDLEATNLHELTDHVDAAAADGCQDVLVDAAELRFVDSSALGAILRASIHLESRGRRLVVAALPSFAARVVAILGIDRRIPCLATVDEALLHLRRDGGPGAAGVRAALPPDTPEDGSAAAQAPPDA